MKNNLLSPNIHCLYIKHKLIDNILSTAAYSLWLRCSAGRTHSALEGNTAVCGWPSYEACFALLCSASLYTMFLTMSQNLNIISNMINKYNIC
jgi:hypothetical protein